VKLPPQNEHGTFIRRLTKEEWAGIKAECEAKIERLRKDAIAGAGQLNAACWAILGHINQIRECEKHL